MTEQQFSEDLDYDDAVIRRFSTRTEDKSITLNEKACRPVCRRRQCVKIERGNPLLEGHTKFRDKTLKTNRLGLFWTGKEQILADFQAEIKKYEFRLIMTEEVYKN